MIAIPLLFLLLLFIYFVKIKKRVNIFFLASIFTTIYFTPVFSGLAVDWTRVFLISGTAVPTKSDFVETHYILYITYALLITLYIAFDAIFEKCIKIKFQPISPRGYEQYYRFLSLSFIAISLIILVYLMLSGTLMKYDAAESGDGLIQSFYLSSVILSVVCLSILGTKKNYIIAVFVLIVSLLSGSRSPLAIFFIVTLIIYMSNNDRKILADPRRILFLLTTSSLGIVFVIISKYTYTFYNIYGSDFLPLLVSYLMGDTVCYYCAFEPSIQLSFYDMVVKNSGIIEPKNFYISSFLALLPFPTSWFGYSGSAFSQTIHEQILPNSGYSIAGNVFAESYFHGGFLGVFIFSVFYVASLSILNYKLYYSNSKLFTPLWIVLSIYLVFFVHRYGLGSLLGHIRNVTYPFLFLLFCYVVFKRGKLSGK